MPTNLRKQAVYGKSLPTIKSLVVTPSDFNIGGIMGLAERRYKVPMLCHNYNEARDIFGDNILPTAYFWDAVKGFFDNLGGVSAKLYALSHVGYTGSAYDGVAATATIPDATGPTSGYATISNTGSVGSYPSATVPAIPTEADYTLKITVDTTLYSLTDISIAVTDDWAGVAAAIQLSLQTATGSTETVTIDGSGNIKVKSATTGSGSSIIIAAGASSGSGDLLTAINALGGGGTTYIYNLDTPVDGVDPVDSLQLDSAYLGELDYSESGNRTGYTLTNGARFTTAIKTTGAASDTYVICDAVAGMYVGDIIKIVATGGGTATVYKVITTIDESTGKISFSGAFHGSVNAVSGDVVTIPGIRLRVWRKSNSGIVSEVDADLGKVWCTFQAAVSDYYINNVFGNSKWIKATDLASISPLGTNWPADVSTVTYLASGVNGTVPATDAHWAADLLAFNSSPVRMLCNPESSAMTIQKAGEVYCKGRYDTPKWIYTFPENQSKANTIKYGNQYQRSDEVAGEIVADWVGVSDPFASSSLAPDRYVPPSGHVMGAWIRTIATLGIHWIPAVYEIPLYGINSIERTTVYSDDDRTEINEAGVNLIQFVNGAGFLIDSFYSPSTAIEYMFGNAGLMKSYIMVSAVDSLTPKRNEPNSFDRIKEDKMAVLNFMLSLWYKGSTGNSPEGECFGRTFDSSGNPTKWSDHIIVQADAVNNPQSSIDAGNRNIYVYFTRPAAAGSIEVGVGMMIKL